MSSPPNYGSINTDEERLLEGSHCHHPVPAYASTSSPSSVVYRLRPYGPATSSVRRQEAVSIIGQNLEVRLQAKREEAELRRDAEGDTDSSLACPRSCPLPPQETLDIVVGAFPSLRTIDRQRITFSMPSDPCALIGPATEWVRITEPAWAGLSRGSVSPKAIRVEVDLPANGSA